MQVPAKFQGIEEWRIIVASEIHFTGDQRCFRYFLFPLDADKSFCYRSRMSFNAFAHSEHRRNYKPSFKAKEILYHFQHLDEKVRHDTRMQQVLGSDPYAGAQVIALDSLWEFYTAIGYDYKKRKWVK